MSALPNQLINNHLTESEAFEFIKFNWEHLQNVANKNVSNYKDKIKKLEDLQSVNIIGQIVGVKAPAWKENELYKLIEGQWGYFSSIGVTKPFTYKLSFRAIVYILQLYEFPLKVNYSNNKVNIKKTTTFKYTEEQSLAILNLNKQKLEESSGVSIYELKNTINLTKVLKTNQTYLYRTLKENLAELELLGCSKTTTYNLTYRGVVFLLLNSKYPLELNIEKQPTTKIVYLKPNQTASIVDSTKDSKPNTEQIKTFLKKAVEEKKARALADLAKAEESKEELAIVDEALYCIERAEELLLQVNLK
jgi:hypothetical protein